MSRKPKQSVTIELPGAFTRFMQDVSQQIAAGDDVATTVVSDDLLQCDCIYGGLYDVAGRRFGFTYYHTDDATWDFDLDAEQIAEIANGTLTKMTLWRCSGSNCDCLYATEDAYCSQCDSIQHFDGFESRLGMHHQGKSPDVLAGLTNLSKIGSAICDYHLEHGHFPPSQTHDANGNLLHSWRSLILPFLDEKPVFERIDFSQPWDSDHNRTVWEHRPSAYGATDCPLPLTHCMAIVDANSIWPPAGRRQFSEITSGMSYTLAVIAANESSVNWMQPVDLDIAAALAEYERKSSLLAVFVDGHVDLIEHVGAGRLRELIRI